MDKNAVKKYAVWARRELIERVSQRALVYGITAKDAGDPNADIVNGHLLSQAEKRQRQALIRNIKTKGYEQVMEEVAYTWFNRFAALRFMEVNGYLPSHIRVFTNDAGEFKPQILAEAIHLELDGLDMNKVYELEGANKSEELFKYLLIVQCNALNSILPGMFQRIEDYTELLLPDYLLREGSVIEQMVTSIPEEDWTDQVQIIGWLYQYYNTEPKDKVFANLKKNIKITKENIPAATQLFTPDWIVHYMVENSLGRLWLEGHPNDALKSEWKYYLDEAVQEPEVQKQLATIRKEYAALNPEEIRVIDPCMGSGHILCVLFDVLVRIYEDYGYTAREAAVKIVENNLWGLDIDERAAQLSYFAVMMKARQYDRRFFNRNVQPHVYAIEESNGITSAPMHDMGLNLSQEEYGAAVKQALRLVEEMHDAKEYGSIINVTPCDWDLLRRFAVPRDEDGQLHLDIHGEIEASAKLQTLINVGETLAQKYHVVCTNPPYMNNSGMGSKLSSYIKENYPDYKADLYACFIRHCIDMCIPYGQVGMMTSYTWIFLASFEAIRKFIFNNGSLSSFIQPEYHAFFDDAFVPICTFTIKKGVPFANGKYIDLGTFYGAEKQDEMTLAAIHDERCGYLYVSNACNFMKLKSAPLAYKASQRAIDNFDLPLLGDFVEAMKGLDTCDNDRFVREWYEVDFANIGFSITHTDQTYGYKWFPYAKGGGYRKWYGFLSKVVNWENDGEILRNLRDDKGKIKSRPQNIHHYFCDGLTWSTVTSYKLSLRVMRNSIFGGGGSALFPSKSELYILALLNSKVAEYYLHMMNQTLNFLVGDILSIPVIEDESIDPYERRVEECISISKLEYDSYETSWAFNRHPLIMGTKIRDAFDMWEKASSERFNRLWQLEEEMNSELIRLYGLEGEVTSDVLERDVTIRKADYETDIRSLISYAVGCMFGRYSLDTPGLVYAGGAWDDSRYCSYKPDKDGIIPICDDDYFEDDIVGRFIRFVEVVYGKETLEENLQFIANALGNSGSSREVIRNYFINDFYRDHLKVYQKRPIYWLFDSGKKNGFKCLIYMHRYQPDTIARIRTDYVHEQQSRYRTAIADMEQRINGASTSERVKLSKQLTTLQAQAEEIRVYEEKIHHIADQMLKIDLDDGVKHNYDIFKDVLAKNK